MHQLSSGDYVGNHWHDKSFDGLRNLPASLKYVVFVTTSPGLPYHVNYKYNISIIKRCQFYWIVVSVFPYEVGLWQ